jgi:hypothetical protein
MSPHCHGGTRLAAAWCESGRWRAASGLAGRTRAKRDDGLDGWFLANARVEVFFLLLLYTKLHHPFKFEKQTIKPK